MLNLFVSNFEITEADIIFVYAESFSFETLFPDRNIINKNTIAKLWAIQKQARNISH